MNRVVRIAIGLAATVLAGGAAHAHGVNWSLSIGVPGVAFHAPAPVYAPPVVVAPPGYYYGYPPPPRVYYAPVYVAPAPVWIAPRHRPHRDWPRGARPYR